MEKEELTVKIGCNIRKARKAKEFTIKDLAFDAGIEYTQVSRIERGKINTSVYQLYIISCALEVNISALFEGI
jgi:transcriptional regulator with XRE-family HTH domain